MQHTHTHSAHARLIFNVVNGDDIGIGLVEARRHQCDHRLLDGRHRHIEFGGGLVRRLTVLERLAAQRQCAYVQCGVSAQPVTAPYGLHMEIYVFIRTRVSTLPAART